MCTCESIRPGIAIMPPASMATSQSLVSPPEPIETIRPSAMITVSPAATGAARSPLRIFPILKTATFMRSRLAALARRDLVMGQSADPRVQPPAIGDAEDHRDLVGHRRIRKHQRHAVIVRAHIDVVLVVHRNIDRRAGTALLGEGGNPGVTAAERIADRIGKGGGEQRIGVLLLAGHADDAALAVALH